MTRLPGSGRSRALLLAATIVLCAPAAAQAGDVVQVPNAVDWWVPPAPDREAHRAPVELTRESPEVQSTTVSRPFHTALTVTLTDNGTPLAGQQVTFTPPASGATAVLSATQVMTDANGRATVTATANATPGGYYVNVAAAGAPTLPFTLANIALGYTPGEDLATFSAFDQANVSHEIHEFLDNGTSWMIIDVCAVWCGPCGQMAPNLEAAIPLLAARGISLNVVPLLQQDINSQPSTAADALAWKQDHSVSGPVLHVSGDIQSAAAKAAARFLALPAALPTTLVVSPDGRILDKGLGVMSPEDITRRVVRLAATSVNYRVPQSVELGSGPGSVVATDVDFDGFPDLVANGGDSGVGISTGPDFAATSTQDLGYTPFALTLGDLTGFGGSLDIATLDTQTDDVRVLTAAAGPSLAVEAPAPVGVGPGSLAVGDLDLDGNADVVTANLGTYAPMTGTYDGNTVSVLYRKKSRTAFEPAQTETVGSVPRDVAIADIDDDGKNDILVANSDNGAGTTIGVLRRNATNTGFDAQQTLTVGTDPQKIATGDLNGDGRVDIVTANVTDSSLSILYRNVTNTGYDPVESIAVPQPSNIAVGDVNADGRLDIVVSDYLGGSVVPVLRNGANTGFTVAPALDVGADAWQLALADLDGQGRLDLAVGHFDGDEVSIIFQRYDTGAAAGTDDVPTPWFRVPQPIHLSGTDTGGAGVNTLPSGIEGFKYLIGVDPADPSVPANNPLTYDEDHPPTLQNGEKIRYVATDRAGNVGSAATSTAMRLDDTAPSTEDDVPSGLVAAPPTVTLIAEDEQSGVAAINYLIGADPANPTNPANSPLTYDPAHKPVLQQGQRIRYSAIDGVGNREGAHRSPIVQIGVATATPTASPTAIPTASPTATPTATPNPGGGGPTAEQIKASLAGVSAPKASGGGSFVSKGSFTAAYAALAPGILDIGWYFVPKGATLSAGKPVLVAHGRTVAPVAGPVSVKVKLTKKGRKLLKGKKRIKLSARSTFTPATGLPVAAVKTFKLKLQ